jgi:hypothetical protein
MGEVGNVVDGTLDGCSLFFVIVAAVFVSLVVMTFLHDKLTK